MRIKLFAILSILLYVSSLAKAQEYEALSDGRDTIYYNYVPMSEGVKPRKPKVDFTIVPLYTPATSLAVGVGVQSVYTTKNSDKSHISASLMASIRGMYSVGVSNVNPFQGGKHTLSVSASASSMPTKFWGVGYNAAIVNSAVLYTKQHYSVQVEYLYRVVKNLYLGPCVEFDYVGCGKKFDAVAPLLPSEVQSEVIATTISAIIKYDTRNSKQNPQKGIYLSLRPYIRPAIASNTNNSSFGVEGSVSGYQKLWKGATLAGEIYTLLGSKYTPWQLYARIGDSHRMRGYYEGQFTDRNMVTLQAELRQNIWRGIGIAAWGGAGNCFSSFDEFKWQHTLPTYGLGVRWAAFENVLLRFDYGFGAKVGGKVIHGPLFSVGSAF
ncbi:MAG: BamA/TamA family outer membrane protein [Alistipes sp.]|nr:BamA/TamA family outer membrane protein [Alistipes sp.]